MVLIIGSMALRFHQGQMDITKNITDIDVVGTLDDVEAFAEDVAECVGGRAFARVPQRVFDGRGLAIAYDVTNKKQSHIIHVDGEILTLKPDNISAPMYEYGIQNGVKIHVFGADVVIAPPELLWALKESHKYKKDTNVPRHALEQMEILFIMASTNRHVPEHIKEWVADREKCTLTKAPKLNQSKQDFFVDGAALYEWDHDSIHEAVKLGNVPAYREFMVDGAEVLTSRDKWEQLSPNRQLDAAYEEALVLTLERSLIPYRSKGLDYQRAFHMGLSKMCTTITSGWFRAWAWNHYWDIILKRFNPQHIDDFFVKLDAGQVKRFGE